MDVDRCALYTGGEKGGLELCDGEDIKIFPLSLMSPIEPQRPKDTINLILESTVG